MREFTIIDTVADASQSEFIVTANFNIREGSVDASTVKIYNVFYSSKHEDNVIKQEHCRKEITPKNLYANGKDIHIVLDNVNYKNKYYIVVNNIYDKLGRKLSFAYDKYISFDEDVLTKLNIIEPVNQSVHKSKNIKCKLEAISDVEAINEVDDSGIAFLNKYNANRLTIEIATNNEFFASDKIVIFNLDNKIAIVYKEQDFDGNILESRVDFDAGSFDNRIIADLKTSVTNSYKYSIDFDPEDPFKFTLLFAKDDQYFIRARLEKDAEIIGDYSDVITFIVKSESLFNKEESYMDSLLYSDSLFVESYEPYKIISKSDEGFTDEDFYIEFNKPVRIEQNADTTEDGLVYLGKCILIRRKL